MQKTGVKYDKDKPRPALVLGDFANAVSTIVDVGTFGAEKYSPSGWLHVENAEERYADAMWRHILAHAKGEQDDRETALPHLAHAAWNVLALLEMQIRKAESDGDIPPGA